MLMSAEIWLSVSVSILCTVDDQRESGSSGMISIYRIPYIYTTCNVGKKSSVALSQNLLPWAWHQGKIDGVWIWSMPSEQPVFHKHLQNWCRDMVGGACSGLWELTNQSRQVFLAGGPLTYPFRQRASRDAAMASLRTFLFVFFIN